MKAPEKIYLQVCGDCQDNDCDNCKFEDLEDNVTWCKDKIFDKDVKYTRTDAFIEKAVEYIKEHLFDYWSQSVTDESKFIDEFRKYMKGDNMTKEIEEIKEYDGKISSNIVTDENNWYVCIKQLNNFEVGKVYCIGKNSVIAVPEYFRLATDEEISQGASMQNTYTTEPTGVRLEKCPKAQKGEEV